MRSRDSMGSNKWSGRKLRAERGTSVIEFAVASVVLFMMIFGLVEFGLAIWKNNVVASLAKDGARYAATHGSTTTRPASSADVSNYVRLRAFELSPTVTTTWPDGDSPSNSPGKRVEVVVQQDYSAVTSFVPFTTLTLRSTAQLVISR